MAISKNCDWLIGWNDVSCDTLFPLFLLIFARFIFSRLKVYTFSLLKNDSLLLVGSAELELRVFDLHWFEKENLNSEDDNSMKKLKASENSVEFSEDTQANVSIWKI